MSGPMSGTPSGQSSQAPQWKSLPLQLEAVAPLRRDRGLHFVDRRQDVLYPELALRMRRCAAALLHAGLGKRGDASGASGAGVDHGFNIGLLLPTSAEFYVALLGAQRAGLAPSPFAPPASARSLADDVRAYARALRAGRCRALIVDQAMATRLGDALRSLEVPVLQIEELERVGASLGEAALAALPELSPERDLALVQYTSGSTSHPKGVAITHAQLTAGMCAIAVGIGLTDDDVNGQWLPVHHDMGLIGSLTGIAKGVDQHLWSPLSFVRDPARWLTQFAARRATIYAGPNFSYAEMAARCDEDVLRQLDLSAWRVAFNGAEPVDAGVLRAFTEKLAPCGLGAGVVMPVYGLAEVTLAATFPTLGTPWHSRQVPAGQMGPGAVVTLEPSAHQAGDGAAEASAAPEAFRDVVSVGAPVVGHEVRIQLLGATLGEGHVGEIQLRGPAVMTGYYRDPQATADAMDEGWLRTGDLGFVADGELYVTGRVKEMMILHGKNYYPHDVEAVVQDLPGYHRGMAVAFASADARGEHMVVVAETRLDDAVACAELAQASQRAVATALSIPRLEVVLVRPGTVPRTTSGKRQRLLVKSRLQHSELGESVVWSSQSGAASTGASS